MLRFVLAMFLVVAFAGTSFAQDKPLAERIKDAGLADKPFSLIVSGKVKKDKLEEFRKIALTGQTETGKEKGCVQYTFYFHGDDDASFTLMETWKDLASLEEHMKTDYTKALIATFGTHIDGKVSAVLAKELKK
jgi:quinol monooxygenase YgiN